MPALWIAALCRKSQSRSYGGKRESVIQNAIPAARQVNEKIEIQHGKRSRDNQRLLQYCLTAGVSTQAQPPPIQENSGVISLEIALRRVRWYPSADCARDCTKSAQP
ncbi:MAG: hypothetical protein WAL09_20020, partial [Pseudolabrys sp.]